MITRIKTINMNKRRLTKLKDKTKSTILVNMMINIKKMKEEFNSAKI